MTWAFVLTKAWDSVMIPHPMLMMASQRAWPTLLPTAVEIGWNGTNYGQLSKYPFQHGLIKGPYSTEEEGSGRIHSRRRNPKIGREAISLRISKVASIKAIEKVYAHAEGQDEHVELSVQRAVPVLLFGRGGNVSAQLRMFQRGSKFDDFGLCIVLLLHGSSMPRLLHVLRL